MPGQLKEVRNRIKSVSSTQQITKAMKMVSAAKLRRAQDKIVQMRPYSQKLSAMLQNIVSGEKDIEIKLAAERPIQKVLVIIMTSDRGLCGGFNANLIKTAKQHINTKYNQLNKDGHVTVMCIGKKGNDVFKKTHATNTDNLTLYSNIVFSAVSAAAESIMSSYIAGIYDKIDIVYSQFKNAATQEFKAEAFLPVPKTVNNAASTATTTDFIYQPSKTQLIDDLVPKILKTQFYKCLLDTNASEHGARMTAMDKATENANELLKSLKITYNRARQAAITTELTEIVSGAAALEG
jgi:F-type H+-transporting ATPase subunit gamma